MEYLKIALQVVVAGGLLNVWMLRYKKSTAYRGGDSTCMRDEFLAYGLPPLMVWVVGFLKLAIALALIAGIWYQPVVQPAAGLLVILMLGAIGMHLKIKDPAKRSLPATLMLVMALALVVL
jgi:divalent metal cation (Fe/Co/Zn/Cd) transporter|tara:strand:- start:152 stop:514 length:363 start_codon:yes stop_codon:yes gene_type:complete